MTEHTDPLNRATILGGISEDSISSLPGSAEAGRKAFLLVLLDIATSLRKLTTESPGVDPEFGFVKEDHED